MTQTFNQLLNQTEQLQPLLKRLPVIVNFVLIIACAQLASEVIWMLLDDSSSDSAALITPVSSVSNKNANDAIKSQQQAFRSLTGAHLFGVAETKKAAPKTTVVTETKLNLVLKGVLAADPMHMASAIIAKSANGKEEIYGINDKIPGGITLKEIHPDHVILERKGRLEILRMIKDKDSNQILSSSNGAQPVTSTSTISSSASKTLKNIRSNLMSDPTSFRKYALPVVVRENGQQVGYRLQPQQNSDLLTQAGIEPSDVITSINGKKLNNMQSSISALKELRSASSVRITVKRNGTEVPLDIKLQ